ncbi:MAG: glycosyltransferase family 9 protein [Verrucomicrobia bacterium]|nr:glycosyltransferase family 9 protein [Verrucomicrobiota bacterium]
MRKILVLRGGALGDFIVTLPAFALLRRHWPAARLELAGNATAAALALDAGLLDAAHSQHESRWSALYGAAPLPAGLAAWLATFDLVVNFWPDTDGELRAHFPLRPDQTFLHGEAQPTYAPAAAHYCAALRPLGLTGEEQWYRFAVGRGRRTPPFGWWAGARRCSATPPYTVALHPGSGSPRKNWPLDRWLELVSKLPQPILVILGEAEIERWSALTSTRLARGVTEQRVDSNTLHLAVDLPLRDLAVQLSRCTLFLGHDSGVSHLAAACGVPSVLLFGPTDPAMWAPPAPHVTVIKRGETLDSISIADVQHATAAV